MDKTIKLFKDFIDDPYLKEIENVRNAVEPILNNHVFIHFTDHSIAHSDRILKILLQLLKSNLSGVDGKKLTQYELFILLSATYFHDIGMQIPEAHGITKSPIQFKDEDYNNIRENHGEISAEILEQISTSNSKDYKININFNKSFLQNCIGVICDIISNHQSKKIYDPSKVIKCPEGDIRIGVLTSLLRIADTLDCTRDRVDIKKLHQYRIPNPSIMHWISCYYIDSVSIDDGFVKITSSSPENFSSTYVDYLNQKLIKNIEKEMNYRYNDIVLLNELWKNNIKLNLEKEIYKQDNKFSASRWTQLPKWVITEIQKEIEYGPPKFTKTTFEESKKRKDWMSYWGFIGNPFLDKPLAYGSDILVETKFFENINSEIESILKSGKGAIKLLIGERGLGKTTLFNYLEGKFGNTYPVNVIDAADVATSSETATQFYNKLFEKTYSIFGYYEKFDKSNFIENIKKSKLRIICIDSLDRLPDDKIKILDEFFKQSQHLLTYMKSNIFLIMSCSDKWKKYLDSKELSYLGYKNQWFMDIFNTVDTKKMIEKRLNTTGKRFEDVFKKDSITPLQSISNHNPRDILINAENLCRYAFNQKINKIDADIIQSHFDTDFRNNYDEFLTNTCRRDTTFKDGLTAVYWYLVDIDRKNLDRNDGVEILCQLSEGALLNNSSIYRYVLPLRYITKIESYERYSERKFELQKNVKHFFSIINKSGYAPRDFLTFFSLEPELPNEFKDNIYKLPSLKDVESEHFYYFEKARDEYHEILKGDIGYGYAVYRKSWNVIEDVIVAILIKVGLLNPQEYELMRDEAFYYDRYNTKVHKTGAGSILAEQSFKILNMLMKNRKEKNIPFIYNYGNIKWIRDTRNLLNRSSSAIYDKFEGIKNKELCISHLNNSFNELADIYINI